MLDSEQSPHRKPARCSRASSSTCASSSRSVRLPAARVGEQRAEGGGVVEEAGDQDRVEVVRTLHHHPSTSTAGMPRSLRCRSSWYSRRAKRSGISLSAKTSPPSATKRTTCREMPRCGISRIRSSSHSSSGCRQGRFSSPAAESAGGEKTNRTTLPSAGITARRARRRPGAAAGGWSPGPTRRARAAGRCSSAGRRTARRPRPTPRGARRAARRPGSRGRRPRTGRAATPATGCCRAAARWEGCDRSPSSGS